MDYIGEGRYGVNVVYPHTETAEFALRLWSGVGGSLRAANRVEILALESASAFPTVEFSRIEPGVMNAQMAADGIVQLDDGGKAIS